MQYLAQIALVVDNYDRAIAYYTQTLGFELIEDTNLTETKRWVRIKPPGSGSQHCTFLLAQAANETQQARIGNQTGGRVFLFLYTDNFDADYQRLKANGVTFKGEPREEPYGKVVVFEDMYGNLWDFIQPQ